MNMTDRFSKTVAIKATDDDEMTATGVVLTPNELDRQLDWLDQGGVRNFYAEKVDDGVMHAAFPTDDAELDRNEVLDEAETIDGVEFDAGDWVVRRQYHDSQRWALVKSGALSSFSIGGTVERAEEVDSVADIPDEVAIPASVDPETVPEKHWPPSKLIEGTVDEISDVDMGAVPSADHAVVKGLGKSPLDSVNSEEEFVAMMRQRGTMNEDQARETWRYMQDAEKAAKDVDMTPPEDVQANAQAALDMREQTDNPNDCGTQVGWARANQLANGESLTEDTIGRMVSFLSRHLAQAPDDLSTLAEDSCQRMMIQAWGGREGLRWAESVQDRLDAEREQTVNEPAESGADSPDKDAMTTTDTDDEPDESGEKSLDEVDDETLGARIKSALGLGADADADDGADAPEESAEKAGQTLSARNVNYAKEVHDDAEEMLRDAGVTSHSATVRTYHEDKTDEFERDSHYEDKAADPATVKEEDPCWDGYTMVGLDGDGNPRCVPDEDVEDVDFEQAVAYEGQAEPPAKAADEPDTDEQKANEPAESGADLGKLDADRVAKLAERADEINT